MKPAPFEYVRPASVEEACAVLAGDNDARAIAGGQTLIPMMAMRLARPSQLVDIARLAELRGIEHRGDRVVIGAATRQVEAERARIVAEHLPLLAAVLPWVGHPPTRNRGTVGGSIANADPAAEIPLVLVTLGGDVLVRTGTQTQEITADDLLVGPMTTSLPAAGLLVAVRFPVWTEPCVGVGFHEVSARKSDFAYVAAAAQVALGEDGRCTRLALGIGGAVPVPTRLDVAARALIGTTLDDIELENAVRAGVENLEIMHDAHATQTYRRRVAVGLAIRALKDATSAAMHQMVRSGNLQSRAQAHDLPGRGSSA